MALDWHSNSLTAKKETKPASKSQARPSVFLAALAEARTSLITLRELRYIPVKRTEANPKRVQVQVCDRSTMGRGRADYLHRRHLWQQKNAFIEMRERDATSPRNTPTSTPRPRSVSRPVSQLRSLHRRRASRGFVLPFEQGRTSLSLARSSISSCK